MRLRSLALLAVAAGLLSSAGFAPVDPMLRNLFLAAGGAMLLVLAVHTATGWRMRGAAELAQEMLAGFIEKDAAPSFVTDPDGRITARNSAASVRFSAAGDGTLAAALRSVLASPSSVLYRLQCRARIDGNAREDVVTARGHVRLAVHVLRGGAFLWRFEDILERGPGGRTHCAVPLPMLTVGRSGAILFMNDAARRLVGDRALTLDRLFLEAAPVSGRIHTLTTAKGPVDVLVREVAGPAARREMFLIPVEDIRGAGAGNDFDSLPVPMMRLSDAGEIREINRLAVKLVGADVQAGGSLPDIMQGLGRPISDWLRETVEGSAKQRSEFLRLARRDKEVFVQVTLTRVAEDGAGGLVAVLNDATELKTLEAQFVQSQKMQAIGQLAGGVAHDFNNLLTAISGHCDLLLLRHDQGDPDYGDLVQIHQNANRAAALVSQLLAFSRKQTLRPELLDLRDTLSDLTHLLNRLVGEKVTLTLSHDPVLKPVRADKRQLEQVLMNLVVNARDAMPQGGEIRIETGVVTLDCPLERDRAIVPPGDYVTVKVSDKGVGIAPDALQKVFEPFYTTKRTGEGTGLGLSTVYGIVKQTGGYIFVDSVVGEGSDFVLFFPADKLVEVEPAIEPAPEPTSTPRQGDGVVLLVEDEAPVRAFASRALRLRGYTVLEADSAEEALRTLEDSELSVDVFVTDVVMPGLDGPTWVRQAMQDRPDVRVVFVSGYAEGAFGEAELSLPNSVFLPKPFSLNQLTETVHRQMH
ncbi:two-component system, cell cycle sensor histidine kinase and response regulator CckA [Cribrihabitans marinus]|uniref:histidine kinase n=1 Tax=Cribrihabitans marinus TaxID=1227549 RepID=A0A1H6WDY5_9RHOB|nr:ATP-binding protein [Cribrihabitans marinus]GGH24331.1 hybrid sensor histidine kinase/response regulator [Cribrihabitans marinus]SEJ13906.1 two-component system, cell cycle sensor histidine kinase and response regulator CckA [Cribrihabitans marinus]